VALPTRLRFKELPPHQLPRSEATLAAVTASADGHDINFVGSVLERWRGATTHRDSKVSTGASVTSERRQPRIGDAPLLQPSLGLDPDRFSLLKKPLS
jgi:hypothetical protein